MTGHWPWWYLNRHVEAARTHGPEESEPKGGIPELEQVSVEQAASLTSDPAARAAEPKTWAQIAEEGWEFLLCGAALRDCEAEVKKLRTQRDSNERQVAVLLETNREQSVAIEKMEAQIS